MEKHDPNNGSIDNHGSQACTWQLNNYRRIHKSFVCLLSQIMYNLSHTSFAESIPWCIKIKLCIADFTYNLQWIMNKNPPSSIYNTESVTPLNRCMKVMSLWSAENFVQQQLVNLLRHFLQTLDEQMPLQNASTGRQQVSTRNLEAQNPAP